MVVVFSVADTMYVYVCTSYLVHLVQSRLPCTMYLSAPGEETLGGECYVIYLVLCTLYTSYMMYYVHSTSAMYDTCTRYMYKAQGTMYDVQGTSYYVQKVMQKERHSVEGEVMWV